MMIHFVTRNKNSRWVRITGKEQKECSIPFKLPFSQRFFKWAYFISFPPNALKETKVCAPMFNALYLKEGVK